MLIGYDASRAFVEDATGTENYSPNLTNFGLSVIIVNYPKDKPSKKWE